MTDLFRHFRGTANTLDEILEATVGNGDGYVTITLNRIFETREDAEAEFARIGFAKSTKAFVMQVGHYSDRDADGKWVPGAPTRTVWMIEVGAKVSAKTRNGTDDMTLKGANEAGAKRLAAFVAKVIAAQ